MSDIIRERIFTLGEMLGGQSKPSGNIMIVNECGEILIGLKLNQFNQVLPIHKALRQELLDREVVHFFANGDGELIVTVRGVEDAE